MKKPIIRENVFENKITYSILNLLINFPGLQLKYIRYALNPENYIDQAQKSNDVESKCNRKNIELFFNGKLENLYEAGFIKKGCIKSREQLRYYLNLLGRDGLNVIRKERNGKKAKYFIKKEVRNEGIRLENKEQFDFFPLDKIMFFPAEYSVYPKEMILGGHVIYGLSDEIYSKLFDNDDREIVKNSLEKIESVLKNIYDIKIKRLHEERDRRFKGFMESTKSDSIKEFLRKDGYRLYGEFFNGIAFSEWAGVDILHSKTIFLYCFKYGMRFIGHIDEKTIEGMADVADIKKYLDKMTEDGFCMAWCCFFLNRGNMPSQNDIRDSIEKGESLENYYNFSKKDVEEILQWGWDNRDLFEMCIPIEIAYSRYDKINDYQLINHINNLK